MVKAHVRPVNGMPRLFIDEQMTAPVFFYGCTLFEHRLDIVEREFKMAAQHGIHLFSVILKMGVMPEARQPSIDNLSRYLDMLLRHDPAAKVLVRINVCQYGSSARKWEESHPGEMVVYEADIQDDGEVKADFDSTMTSVFSEDWRKMAEEALEAFVRYFVEHPVYADHVVAYHIGGGESDEWFHFGYREGGCDVSAAAQKALRAHVQAKYGGDVARLRAAYGRDDLNFEDIRIAMPIPGNTGRNPYPTYYLSKPEEQIHVDYNELLSTRIADLIKGFARIVKRVTNGDTIVLCFYGYWYELGGDSKSGHFAFQRLLECPDIDGFSSPIGYWDRDLGGTGPYMCAIDSVVAHHKMWFVENDIRTFLLYRREPGDTRDGFQNLYNFEDLYEVYKREAGTQMIRGCASWYMDLAGRGWFYHPAIWEQIHHLERLYDATLPHITPFVPEVAVVLDEEEVYRIASAHGTFGYTTFNMRMTFYRLGLAVGFYTGDDWLAGKADSAKLTFLLNPTGLKGAKGEGALEKIRRQGQTTVFIYGFGDMDTAQMQRLTGMTLARCEAPAGTKLPVQMVFCGSWEGCKNVSAGREVDVNPLFYVQGDYTEAFAQYTIGEAAGKIGFAMKRQDGYQTIFFGGFELDRDLLLRIARLAGVREYGYFGDYILPGPQMMITHTTEPGEKTVHFPRVCDVYDYYENRWYEQVDRITKTLDKGKTFLYIYGSRREIEGWNLPVWPGDPI